MIRVKDLQKSYGDLRAVDGISFEIPEDIFVYTSVQVIDQYGHGQYYIVTKGKHTVDIDLA